MVLSMENGCKKIEVYPNFDLEEVIIQILTALAAFKVPSSTSER